MPALQYARRLEAPLAAATLLLMVAVLRSPPQRFPSWLDAGPITLPAMSMYPVPLALLVVAVGVGTYRRDGALGARRLLVLVLAVLLLLASAYAVAALNNTSGGVFFAGMPALLLGLLLCGAVVVGEAVAVGRRVYGSAG